ncbi:nuclear matrix constituent protein 1b-like [Haliotis rufescens]|uniref:nuclear matrix constituent protein 1b-like n=1 Tax=Haliotis rufescens TaxID=6454 RepID=UPI00201F3926|nr:nuclear matrix constituent protein 1b-like [Haliotis rufescens]
MTNIRLLVFLLLLHGLHTAPAREKKLKKNAQHYPGRDKDLPKSVVSAKTGRLIKHDKMQLVIRPGKRLGDCKKACQHENLIKCNFYRLMETRRSCLLMTSRGVKGKSDDPKKGQKDKQLKKLMKNQQDHTKELNEITKILQRIGEGRYGNMKKIQEDARKMSERIKKILKGEGKMGTVILELSTKLNKVSTDVASVKMANEELTRQLSSSDSKSPIVDRKLAHLVRDVAELKTRTEMNPTVFKITKNQRILAEALESIDRELTVFQSKLSHIDERTDEMRGRQTREELHRKTINDALQVLTKAVKSLRGNIKKIINPESTYNIEKTNAMKAIRSQLSIMTKANKRVVYDMTQTRTELNSLVKDLVGIQLAHQKSVLNIEALGQDNLHAKQNYRMLKTDQDQMMTKIQTLASVYRSLLTTLHNLEIKEINVMHKLEHYGESVSKLNANFLGVVKGTGKSYVKGKKTSKDLEDLSRLLKSQRYIYKQVLELRKELKKIKKKAGIRSKSKKGSKRRKKKKRKKKGKGMLNISKKMKGIRELTKLVAKYKNKGK